MPAVETQPEPAPAPAPEPDPAPEPTPVPETQPMPAVETQPMPAVPRPARSAGAPPLPDDFNAAAASQAASNDAPSRATRAPMKKAPIIAIGIAAVLALAIVGISACRAISRLGSASTTSSSSGSGISTPTATPNEGDYLDDEGNLALRAITDLSGKDIIKVLDDADWRYADDSLLWYATSNDSMFYVYERNADNECDDKRVAQLDVNGRGGSTIFVLDLDDSDYSSMHDAFESTTTGSNVLDTEWVDDETCVFVLKGAADRMSIAAMNTDDSDDTFHIVVFNEEYCASSESRWSDLGSSVPEVWQGLTGRKLEGSQATVGKPEPTSTPSTPSTPSQNFTGSFGEGTYVVGTDFPAGEYKLYTIDSESGSISGYYEVYPSKEAMDGGDIEDIINNDNFDDCAYLLLSDGQGVSLERCTLEPIASAKPSENPVSGGVYKIGFDIPAGTIVLKRQADTSMSVNMSGFYEVYSSADPSKAYDGEYFNVGSFDDTVTLELKDGDYLRFNNAVIESK